MEGLQLKQEHTYKPDWRLIPREEEDKYLKCELKEVVKIFPKCDSIPPVLAEIMKQKVPTLKDLKMERVYNELSPHLTYKIAEDGMTPNYKIKVQIPDEFKKGIVS